MIAMRWIFVLAALGGLPLIACHVQWEGVLVERVGPEDTRRGPYVFTPIHTPRSPVWRPPEVLTGPRMLAYPYFVKAYSSRRTDAEIIQESITRDYTIEYHIDLDRTIVDYLLWLWLVTGVTGVIYWSIRGTRRDGFLQCVMWAGIGSSGAVAFCVAAYFCAPLETFPLYYNEWGRPKGEFGVLVLLFLCLVLGAFTGALRFPPFAKRLRTWALRHSA
jgi:hypothetical protein